MEHWKQLTHSRESLFSTDANATIRWVDVNMVRSRKLKTEQQLTLDGDSSDIFFPSWIDSYYPNRAEPLENMHLSTLWLGTIGSRNSQVKTLLAIH